MKVRPHTAKERPSVLPAHWFVVGDIVTRDGTDRQEVIETNQDDDWRYAPDAFTVRCTRAPADGWCDVGEEEFNLTSRYSLVSRAAGTTSLLEGA